MAGLPVYLQRRRQSVLNAAARLIYGLGFRDHITDAFICLHWLCVPQRIQFKLAVLTYKFLFNHALRYIGPLVRVTDLPDRRARRSANTNALLVPSVRLSSVGDRAFLVAAPRTWNDLPTTVTSAQSLQSFQRHLETYLYQRFFQDIIVTPEWTLQQPSLFRPL